MTTYKQLQDKFNKDVEKLQKICKHKETRWLPYMWAPGHFDGEVLSCNRCCKILEKRNSLADFNNVTTENNNKDKIIYTTF